jgi:hypothetical protein
MDVACAAWNSNGEAMNSAELRQMRFKVESEQKWLDEIDVIPFIQFPADWKIKVIPPFGDAVVRFCVKLPSGKERSVYLDNRHALGIYEGMEPYWEVYPYRDDTARCGLDEIDKLLEYIGDESE